MPEGTELTVIGALFMLTSSVLVGQSKILTLAAPSKHFAEQVKFPTFCCMIGADFGVYQCLALRVEWEETHGLYRNMLDGSHTGGNEGSQGEP